MSFIGSTHALFDPLADACLNALGASETLTLKLSGEDQHYLRFNHGRVRQSTEVEQRRLSLVFQANQRRVIGSFDLSGVLGDDVRTALSLLERARGEAATLPEDPFITPVVNHGTSHQHNAGQLPDTGDLLAQLGAASSSLDFAGLYAGGLQLQFIRSSAGTDHRFSTESFFLDYSLFTRNPEGENKAVKGLYAGRDWDARALADNLGESARRLPLLEQSSRLVNPGHYRVYFAPAAVDALIGMFSWGGVSYGAWKRGDSALSRLIEGKEQLSPLFSLRENFNLGLTPRFNSLGELSAECVSIIEAGSIKELLTSSRTAREYGVPSNQAEHGEGLRSAEMQTGDLDPALALGHLGTGLYVGNLHYLNWSDHLSARVTGITRYACFWVENGKIVAPIRDLRFDESLYRVFGPALEAISAKAETVPETGTYGQRSLGGASVPGILVSDFRFTL